MEKPDQTGGDFTDMILEHLEPHGVFHFFEQLCAIPHGSGNTKAISDWCVRFAQERGLEHHQDELNNVIIIAPASPGYEAAPPILIQGHLDMVCAVAPDCDKDMTREGLDLFVEGDWIGARGTTLGGDDGIAVAMGLALLDDPALPHPRLELVFTVDEETGMFGAAGLDPSPLQSRTLINLDSEEEGVFTVACAGGARVNLGWAATPETRRLLPLRLELSGGLGGHSGMEIDKGRANANILMGRLLRALSRHCDLGLSQLSGGTADNVIPQRCTALVGVAPADAQAVLAVVDELDAAFRQEFALSDPGLCLRAALGTETELQLLPAAVGRQLIQALTAAPNGVQEMSRSIPGQPETSCNLGVARLEDGRAVLHFSVRSSVASRKAMLIQKLLCVGELTGADCQVSGDYPAWEYRADSPLRERMLRIFRAQYGREAQVVSIHAGLECGLLGEKLPGLDAVSLGPDMRDIHTAGERLSISSVQRVWRFLLEVLKQSK